MSELINGRTPEEIKRGLRCETAGDPCSICTYQCECLSEDGDLGVLNRDALALIERLESERDAALAKVPRWISVEERLPPPQSERYLAACVLPTGDLTVHTVVWAWDENDEQGDWICWDVVTHWMPLPEPPKEGE